MTTVDRIFRASPTSSSPGLHRLAVLVIALLTLAPLCAAGENDLFTSLNGSPNAELAAMEAELEKVRTQGDMTAIAFANADYWDREMNRIYRKKLAEFAGSERQKALRQAQRAWIAFRDADMAVFAADKERIGSITSTLRAIHLAMLTKERCRSLNDLAD